MIANAISITSKNKAAAPPLSEYTNTSSFLKDGVNESIDLGTNMAAVTPSGSTQMSISFWWKPTALAVNTIFRADATHYIWIAHFSGQLRFAFGVATATVTGYTWTPSIDTWYHVVITFDGSESVYTDKIKIYVDGLLVSTTTDSDPGTTTPDWATYPTGTNFIGQYGTGIYYDQGHILDFCSWGYKLTSDNVTQLYNGGAPYVPTNMEIPPLHWWQCGDDDDPTTIVYDKVGSTNGTPLNMESGDKVNDIPS